ncbi:hypothetical protein B0T24DRAFT_632623 [Lasiosphaeria ovina]|uniref:Fungal N-terminal domain-containing protein n=1 Tax=Lasiosphaeria ovina TaxID=92902 RepID=A0AAE0N4T5_9PEZI|nr:hypothetical protein B0T24DRAFT_632623 [Lasiosphaeria ovina]
MIGWRETRETDPFQLKLARAGKYPARICGALLLTSISKDHSSHHLFVNAAMTGLEIIGAVDAALGLVSRVYKAYTNIRNAPAEIRAFCDELESLRHVLNDVSTSVSSVEMQNLLYADDKSLGMCSILIAIRGCESEFNTAWRDVSDLRSEPGVDWKTAFPKVGKTFRWILNAGAIEKSTQRLQSHKQNLVLSMLHSYIQVNQSALQGVSSVKRLVENLGDSMGSRMENLRGELLCNLRLLECQIINQVSSLSGTARTQHDANERLVQESSERFSNLIDLSGADDRNPPASGHGVPQVPSWEPQATTILSEQDTPAGKSDRKGKWTSGPDLLQEVLGSFRATTRRSKSISMACTDIQDASDLNAILSMAVQKASRRKSSRTLLGLSNKVLPNMGIFAKINDILGAQNIYNPFEPLIQVMFSIGRLRYSLSTSGRYSDNVLQLATDYIVSLELLLEVMGEIQDSLVCCEREYVLYPEPELRVLMSTLYFAALDFFETTVRSLSGPVFLAIYKSERLRYKAKKIMKLSKRVTKEAEYFHRREVREVNNRVREVDRKQDQVIRALEEQQKVLEAFREEQKVLATISDHQQVLQDLQQLLARFPPFKGESSRVMIVAESAASVGVELY